MIKLLISPEYSCLDIAEYHKTTQNNIGRGAHGKFTLVAKALWLLEVQLNKCVFFSSDFKSF